MKEHMDNAFKLLMGMVNMDSGSSDMEDINRFVDYIKNEFENAGMNVTKIKNQYAGDFLECTAGSGKRKILLLGHMDTVFPSGTAERRPFNRIGNLFYGPGVLDMKGGIVVLLYAVRDVLDRLPDDTSLVIFLNTDEETGSKCSRERILTLAKDASACLSFEPAKPGTITTERKGIISFKLIVQGVSAHSGVNYDRGRSAIQEISNKICSLYELSDSDKAITVNAGTIEGGDRINIVADHAAADVEVRYFDPGDGEILRRKIMDIAERWHVEGTSTRVEIISERPPLKSDRSCEKLLDIAKSVASKLGRDITGRRTGGGGDASFAGATGIPVIDGLGPEGEDSHTDREFALADSFKFKIELASGIILEIANGGLD